MAKRRRPPSDSGGIIPTSSDLSLYASFSDETKTDSRLSLGYRATINAQIRPQDSLDWYYTLATLLSLGDEELKSSVAVERFQFLPAEIRRKVRAGLSNVRIHIFDAKPFALEISDILHDITGSHFPLHMLRRLERSGEERMRSEARRLLSFANAYVLDRVTRFFPAERLSAQLESSALDQFEESDLRELGIPFRRPRPMGRALSRVKSGGEHVTLHEVDRALAEGAKASAVLTDVQTRLEQLPETVNEWPVFPLSRFARLQVVREVSKTHVFDEGDSRGLEGVEQQRERVITAALDSSERIWEWTKRGRWR